LAISVDRKVPGTTQDSSSDPIRVMIVDDSAVVRGLVSRMLETDPDISVVASVGNGQIAVNTLSRRMDIDVILLDIEMPVMDGLTALPLLLKADREVKIIIASTLTLRNAEISMRAMQAGAADYIPKPTSSREISGGQDFQRDLLEKVKSLGGARRNVGARRKPFRDQAKRAPVASLRPAAPSPIVLRQPGKFAPEILAIGSSTGGPQALFTLLRALNIRDKMPIIITQHMPATFTTILADHINRMTDWPCTEGKDGEPIEKGRIYLAPGDYHMTVGTDGPQRVIRLNQDPPENFCRPSVDPMLRSVAKIYGARTMVVILTGMGADGLKGGQVISQAGGTIVAQDEATSVVWGMPGAVATAGICSAVLPLDGLAPHIMMFANRGAR
jgi:two-component system, chemotaxis family, protein-glutamate methylesterase/glutaminase